MGLISRLTVPAEGEEKIAVHQFQALMTELRRGASGVDAAFIASEFNIVDAGELAELDQLIDINLQQRTSRELVHDALLLGEAEHYNQTKVANRILNSPPDTDIWEAVTERSHKILSLSQNGDHVLEGCQVTRQPTPDLTVAIAAGSVLVGNQAETVTAQNVTVSTPDANLPRIDLVVVEANGVPSVVAGTPDLIPKAPAVQQNQVALAFIFVRAGVTEIVNKDMLDTRIVKNSGSIMIGKNVDEDARNNVDTMQVYATQNIPASLLQNRVIRMRSGGSMLFNDGVGTFPTVTMRLQYGSTVLYEDVTRSFTPDPQRRGWSLDFSLIGRDAAVQAMSGEFAISNHSGMPPAAEGFGDMGNDELGVKAMIGGSATEDSTAEHNLSIRFRMSSAHVQNEIVMDYFTAELL